MIKINLLTAERKVAKKKIAVGGPQFTTVACGAILVAALAACGWRYLAVEHDNRKLDDDLGKAQKEAASLHSVIAQVQDFEQRKAKLQQRVALIEQLRSQQIGPVHMLDQISRALPTMVWLVEIKQLPGSSEVTIDGRASTITAVTDFASGLEATGYFKKSVEIVNSTTQTIKEAPGELVSFQLKAVFQIPGQKTAAPDAAKGAAAAAKPKSAN